MRTWQGRASNVRAAQDVLAHRARCNSEARDGRYTRELEDARRELGDGPVATAGATL